MDMARDPGRSLYPSPLDDAAADRAEAGSQIMRTQLLDECDAMVMHALASGMALPPNLFGGIALLDSVRSGALDTLSSSEVVELTVLHGQLSHLVAPAKPHTLYLMQNDPARSSMLSILGPLPNIRRLMAGAIVFVAMFIGTSLSPSLNKDTVAGSIYSLDGTVLLVNLTFIIAAAGIGSCFHVLFAAHKFVSEGTYEPKYESTYWMRIAMGVMSGLILAEMVGIDFQDGKTMGKPILALLGGFSATLLHRILNQLVTKVESMFSSDPAASERARPMVPPPLALPPPPPPPEEPAPPPSPAPIPDPAPAPVREKAAAPESRSPEPGNPEPRSRGGSGWMRPQ